MLIDQKETHEVLRQIVFKVTANRALDEDLLQEALIHLWLREQQCPGQTASWYLQSCRFFLQNHLRNGRSVDSNKHSHSNAAPSSAGCKESPEPCADGCASADSVLGLVSAREIVSLLNKWLMPLERQILRSLAEGSGVRETAGRLKISHTQVIRLRRGIAALALRLGIEPAPRSQRRKPARKNNIFPVPLSRRKYL